MKNDALKCEKKGVTSVNEKMANLGYEATRNMTVPSYRDGECKVRQLWDNAVADAMGWDKELLTHLRQLLHKEPHVRGLGYNQYK